MSTLTVATVKSASSAAPVFQNTSGTEIGQLAKAWVHFKGTGTVSIYDSFNVSSITDSSQGHYIVNLTNAMSNINYAAFADGRFNTSDGDGAANITLRRIAQTTTSFGIRCSDASANTHDPTFACGVIFGD